MNIQSLKQRLSLHTISERVRITVSRFPLALTFLMLLTGLLSWLAWQGKDPGYWTKVAFYYMSVGVVLDFALALWAEEQTSRRRRNIVRYTVLGLWTAYCLWLEHLCEIKETFTPAFFIGNGAWIVAVVILVPFVAFLRSKDDIKAWHMLASVCKALVLSGVVAGVMYGGFAGLLAGIKGLFIVTIPDKLWAILFFVTCILLAGFLFLSLIPYREAKHNESTGMSRFLLGVMKWLILPLLGCYILVLYVYMVTIIVHWELPKGMISYLVSAVMIGFVISYVILYPQIKDGVGKWKQLMTRWLPIIILPLLALMTVGVIRRFADYGLTAPRLYLATLLAWYYVVCLLVLLLPQKRFRWIFFSFGLLFLLSSGHPLNYYRLCKPVLVAKIDKVIADKQLSVPFELSSLNSNSSLTQEEADELSSDIRYMRDNYGKQSVEQWIGKEKDEEQQAARTKLWEDRFAIKWNEDRHYPCPQGFTTFRTINEYGDITLPEDSLYDGALHFARRAGEEVHVFAIDTATVRNTPDSLTLRACSSDGQAEIVLTSFRAIGYSDHTIDIDYYSGYLFSND